MLYTIIIDELELFKDGLKHLLSSFDSLDFNFMEVKEIEAMSNKSTLQPDLFFIEIGTQREVDLKRIKKYRKAYKKAKIIALSKFEHSKIVRESFQKGADAFISKRVKKEELEKGINEVLEGRTFISDGLRLTPKFGQKEKNDANEDYAELLPLKQKLTKREAEVLSLIILAKSNKEIGKTLFISEQTVGVHKKNIMRKLGVHNTVSLIRLAIDHNLT